jgi:N-acetylmuramoyl-L-alanine amidase
MIASLALALQLAAAAQTPSAVEPRASAPAPRAKRTVVVDAGHGGPDNGMAGPLGSSRARLYEKQITLAVAKRVGTALKARGVGVVYTRTTDTLIALSDRGRIANEAAGNLFLSIHVNAANPSWSNPGGARGFETYFLSDAKTQDERRVEQMENASLQFEDGPSLKDGDPLKFIVADMLQNEHLRESSELAAIVQRSLQRIHPGPNRGVKQAGFRVLVTSYMPSVLIEIGFGTNPKEADYLLDPDEQNRMASAIADAAVEYLDRYERRVSGAGSRR